MTPARRAVTGVLLAVASAMSQAATPTIRAISATTPPAAKAQAPGQLQSFAGTGRQIRAINSTRDQVLVTATPATALVSPRVTTPAAARASEDRRAQMLADLNARMSQLQANLDGRAPPAESSGPAASPVLKPYPLGQHVPPPALPNARYNVDTYRAQTTAAARAHGVDEALVRAVIHAESAFKVNAVSHAGAGGLMQLMPATATRFGVSDRFDATQNIDGGTRYLAWLLDRYDGDITLATAAYNAGEGAVDRYGGVPPYRETRGYVRKVADLLGGYRAALGGGAPSPWDLLPVAYRPAYAQGTRMISTSAGP